MKIVVGITGGIACGKSNISQELSNMGYYVIDSDKIAKSMQAIGGLLYNKVIEEFGPSYLNEDKTLNRKKLSRLVFNDEKALKKLNSIAHPLIINEIKVKIKNNNGLIFLDAPLLFELGLDSLCDYTICCYIPYSLELERLMNRDKIDQELAAKKIKSQMDLELKALKSTFVINTSGTFIETKLLLLKILKELEEKKNGTN